MTFEIKKAALTGVPTSTALWGPPGSGKTWTALHMARGLVGPTGKIGLIDTERKRSLFYADLVGGWDHLDLNPPFTPDRYDAALADFENAGGYGCVIIDTNSHVWQGEGGVLDMADSGKKRNGDPLEGLAKWKAPKMAFTRMRNRQLRSSFHVIFNLRVKEGTSQKGSGANAEIKHTGLQPICGSLGDAIDFIHEMSIAVLLGHDHAPVFPGNDSPFKPNVLIPAMKAPGPLMGIFQKGQPLGLETGQKIAEYFSRGAAFNADLAKTEREARNLASLGTERYAAYWGTLTADAKRALLPLHDELKSLAAESDREAANDTGQHEDRTEGLPL